MLRTLFAAALALALAPLAAQAQTYRCVDKEGRKHYSQTVPEACVGQMIEQLNSEGVVINRILPPPTPEQRAAQKAADEKKAQEAEAAKERERRDKALLATYTSVQDIEDARARSLAENQRAASDIKKRIAELEKRHAAQDKELQPYTGGKRPPARLAMDFKNTQSDLAAQSELLAQKQKEIAQMNAKYDDDKKRFLELTGRPAAAAQ